MQLQHYNDLKHTANVVKTYLDSMLLFIFLSVTDWPPTLLIKALGDPLQTAKIQEELWISFNKPRELCFNY